jgi:hypothetical protein
MSTQTIGLEPGEFPPRARASDGRRAKTIELMLMRAGVRWQSIYRDSDPLPLTHMLVYWATRLLHFDAECHLRDDTRGNAMNVQNVVYLLLTESPAVWHQPLRRLTELARRIGHTQTQSFEQARTRFHHLWRACSAAKMLVWYGGSEMALIPGYDVSEHPSDLARAAGDMGVAKLREARTGAGAAVDLRHSLTPRGTREQPPAGRKPRLNRRRQRFRRAQAPVAAHEVGVSPGAEQPRPVIPARSPLVEVADVGQPIDVPEQRTIISAQRMLRKSGYTQAKPPP